MFTHYKQLATKLSVNAMLSMANNRFTLDEFNDRHAGIGWLNKDDKWGIHIYPECFYVRNDNISLNTHTLSLIAEIQELDKNTPMQKDDALLNRLNEIQFYHSSIGINPDQKHLFEGLKSDYKRFYNKDFKPKEVAI